MDKAAVLRIIKQFKKELEKQGLRVDRLVLYGSWATGKAEEGSDIDVVVVSPDFAGKGYWDRIRILSNAIYEIFEPIEAVALTPEEWDRGDSTVVEYARSGETI